MNDSELLNDKDSGMESIVSSKDETPERKNVRRPRSFAGFWKLANLALFFKEEPQIEDDYEDVSQPYNEGREIERYISMTFF